MLQKLKEETKYNRVERAKYPPFAGTLLNMKKQCAPPHPVAPISKKNISKLFLQTTLSFPKKRKEEITAPRVESSECVYVVICLFYFLAPFI
jgi:hypothetical protein